MMRGRRVGIDIKKKRLFCLNGAINTDKFKKYDKILRKKGVKHLTN
jgi:hypothetical protein